MSQLNGKGDGLLFSITERTEVMDARSQITKILKINNFDENTISRVQIIVSEMGANLIKHTDRGGEIILSILNIVEKKNIDIYSIDNGKGMEDIDLKILGKKIDPDSDNFKVSFKESLGYGLGSIKRLSDNFDIFSKPGKGTVIFSRIGKCFEVNALDYGVISVPKPGEEANGDSWKIIFSENKNYLIVVDGLGHGVDAAKASNTIIKGLSTALNEGQTIEESLDFADKISRSTRGGAVCLVEIDKKRNEIQSCIIGNISGIKFQDEKSRYFVQNRGTVGYKIQKKITMKYSYDKNTIITIYSDGLNSKLKIINYKGLLARRIPLLTGILWRDFRRKTDDSTLMIFKCGEKM